MMVSVLELLVLVLVVPVIILIAAVVVRYLSQKNGALLVTLGGLAVMGFIFLVFVGFFFARNGSQQATVALPPHVEHPLRSVPEMNRVETEIPENLLQERNAENQPLVASKPGVPQKADDLGLKNSASLPKDAELPGWVTEGMKTAVMQKQNLFHNSRPVFQSGLFATREEALQDALANGMHQMQTNLTMREPHLTSSKLELTPELVRQTAYRRSYYQTVEHDFGDVLKSGDSFKQNMFRAYVELDDSPVVRHQLVTRWKQNIGNERSLWVGGVFGLMTLICIGAAVYLRTDSSQATIHSSH
ncbi:hypothetical protein [Gimesia sp.]|uniref:hypothetical protein n=1 Tax=Gimesia sp. TaxID=2024833 RepID=UPI003A94C3E6